jgi:hypothetical protein
MSLPLLARINTAVRHIADGGDTPRARWARDILAGVFEPAFANYPPLHQDTNARG